jgi:4-hydroxy-tetrahydrodipicolinate synthase
MEQRLSRVALAPSAELDAEYRGARITGIIPPIPTPFRNGRLDLDSMRRELDYLQPSVTGYLVGGSTGEYSSLSMEERDQIVRTVAAHTNGERSLVVSIADNSIEHSRRLSECAGEVGASLLVLSCPNYFPNNRAMLGEYFAAISDFASADLCLYDNPVASGTQLSIDDIAAICACAPRVTHIKVTDSAIGKMAALRESTSLVTFAGDDSVLWHHLNSGASGMMTAIPMIYPERTAEMWSLFAAGEIDAAYDQYVHMTHFIHISLSSADYPGVVKAVLHEQGALASPEVRLPLVSLSSDRRAEVLASFQSSVDLDGGNWKQQSSGLREDLAGLRAPAKGRSAP